MSESGTGPGTGQLRQLVREVLAELVRPAAPPSSVPAADVPAAPRIRVNGQHASQVTAAARVAATPPAQPGSWTVRISSDDELHAFVLHVLRLADNPKVRRDLISGRSRFSLAGQPATAAAQTVHRVEKGAVTERIISTAAKAGARIVLGPRAVMTPLARDKARTLGVPIEKER